MANNKNKTRQVHFRISEEDYEEIKKSADLIGISVSEFCRRSALGIASDIGGNYLPKNELKEIVSELKRIGNNINQIAKIANTNNYIAESDLHLVLKELNNIWQLLNVEQQNKQID